MTGIITVDNLSKNRIDGSHLGENQVSFLFYFLKFGEPGQFYEKTKTWFPS